MNPTYKFPLMIFGIMMGFALVASLEAAEITDEHGMNWDSGVYLQYQQLKKEAKVLSVKGAQALTKYGESGSQEDLWAFIELDRQQGEMIRQQGHIEGVVGLSNMIEKDMECVERTSLDESDPDDERMFGNPVHSAALTH